MPSKEICDHLLERFLTFLYPLSPILHLPDFLDQYGALWKENVGRDWHSSLPLLGVSQDSGFVCLMFAVFFCACTNISTSQEISGNEEQLANLTPNLYDCAMTSLTLAGFPQRPTLNTLAAYLFSQIHLPHDTELVSCPEYISTAYRAALSIGLHRDVHTQKQSTTQTEVRRRLWHYVIHADIIACCTSGLQPLLFDQSVSTTKMPSAYEDRAKSRQRKSFPLVLATLFPVEFPNHVAADVRHLTAIARYTTAGFISRMLRQHHEKRLTTRAEIAAVENELWHLRNSLVTTSKRLNAAGQEAATTSRHASTSLRSAVHIDWTTASAFPVVSVFCSFSKLLLHLYLHKAYLNLYAPLIESSDREMWLGRHNLAVRHAQAFLQIYIHLHTNKQLHPFCQSYPQVAEVIQPLKLLLIDISAHIYSDEAETSYGIVDAIFSLYQIDGAAAQDHIPPSLTDPSPTHRKRSMHPSIQHTWYKLAETRRQAWESIGRSTLTLELQLNLTNLHAQASICVCGCLGIEDMSVMPPPPSADVMAGAEAGPPQSRPPTLSALSMPIVPDLPMIAPDDPSADADADADPSDDDNDSLELGLDWSQWDV